MRHTLLDPQLFVENRKRLAARLPENSLAIVNANDVLPTNADGTLPMAPNSDLFYLTGIEQEESVLVLAPHAWDPAQREILFIRPFSQELLIWEGKKHTREEAQYLSGAASVRWLSELPRILHQLMCECDAVYLNGNEHKRAVIEVQSRDARFAQDLMSRYPLHSYRRLAPHLHTLRAVKSPAELDALREAVRVTKQAFERVARFTQPGVMEYEIEAEYAHEYIRQKCRFAYSPIIASGPNACVLHYTSNDAQVKDGDLLLLDVGASYANYNADLTRTIPANGRFTPRQKQVYLAVLKVMKDSIQRAQPGVLHRDWQKAAQLQMNEELVSLGLLTKEEALKPRGPMDHPACWKYFMHGLGHPLGLDVHDVGIMSQPFAPGWVLTVEPGIYIPEEGVGVRLENDILITEKGPIDLMEDIPVEPDHIEQIMAEGKS